jgi:transcriptional regulator with XRE-family HTH domain
MSGKSRNHSEYTRISPELSRQIGANLRFFRQQAAISLKEAARLLGISYQQLQKYETGANRISAEYIHILKKAYDVPYEDFFMEIDAAESYPDLLVSDPVARAVFWKLASLEDQDLKRRIRQVVNLIAR